MRILKIVHTGDLHLGALFTATPEIANERRIDQLGALLRTVEVCNERKADVLLIAGDLFDSLKVEPQLLAETKSILESCISKVFIAPGNHDPATPDSCYSVNETWPDNVYIFRGGLESVELPGQNACVWGAAFSRSFQLDPLVTEMNVDDSKINILVLHGELISGGQTDSRYNPIPSDLLPSFGVEYVALGHSHKSEMHRVGDFLYGYCGTPEGCGFDEQGDKGIFAGYVSKGFAHMDYISTCSRKYVRDTVDVSGCTVAKDFADAILNVLSKRYGADYKKNIYDLVLRGELPKGVMADVQMLTALLKEELHFVRFTDTTTTQLDIDTLNKDNSLRGAFVRAISNRLQNDEKNRDKYLRALLYGLRAFDGEVIVSDDK